MAMAAFAALAGRNWCSSPRRNALVAARSANLRAAFRYVAKEGIKGCDLVLVDNMLTTGATADVCVHHPRRAGARSVHVLTYARVVRDGTIHTD